ncbi:MAG: 50S ribosomal protein L22 [Lachnospiraceae bacterium]|jgi:large subunit ribosomal protein L22|nr:50S ribosomal protein L22 [Lachnospiraceae bacterium]
MAEKYSRTSYKRKRNAENRETRPSAKLSYARVSVQKACFVLDAIRGKDVQTALGILAYSPRYASSIIKKLLESAIANAENNNGMSADNLYIAECYANKGPTMKRVRPRAQGRAYRIEKRMSHITIVLDER